MRPSVLESFVGFTRDFEGATTFMYLDVLGYVTTGYGNLINTTAAATALPWRRPDGTYASRDEIIAEWAKVRSHREMALGGGMAFAKVTTLRLDAQGVANLVRTTIDRNEVFLAHRYSAYFYETWPACAQMAVHSLAWACGPAYRFPKMDAALADRDFETAAREIEMTPKSNPGNNLKARNRANELLMRNAQRVDAFRLDPDTLNWTSLLGVNEAETLPDLSKFNEDSDPPPPLVQLNTPIMTPASKPTTYPRPLSEAETGSGGIIHPLRYDRGPSDPDDAA